MFQFGGPPWGLTPTHDSCWRTLTIITQSESTYYMRRINSPGCRKDPMNYSDAIPFLQLERVSHRRIKVLSSPPNWRTGVLPFNLTLLPECLLKELICRWGRRALILRADHPQLLPRGFEFKIKGFPLALTQPPKRTVLYSDLISVCLRVLENACCGISEGLLTLYSSIPSSSLFPFFLLLSPSFPFLWFSFWRWYKGFWGFFLLSRWDNGHPGEALATGWAPSMPCRDHLLWSPQWPLQRQTRRSLSLYKWGEGRWVQFLIQDGRKQGQSRTEWNSGPQSSHWSPSPLTRKLCHRRPISITSN